MPEYRIYEFKKPGIDWRETLQRLIPTFGILFVIWVFSSGFSNVLSSLSQKVITIPIFIISLVLHEMAHAYMADFLGDPTPRLTGRLSFNPLKHLDVFGTLLFLFCGFGWAKPVQVESSHFRNPNRAMVSIGLAGPLCNLLLAILSCFAYKYIGLQMGYDPYQFIQTISGQILFHSIQINVLLAVFNLIPVPPLDGSRLIHYILPNRFKQAYYRLQEHSFLIFAFLFIFGGQIITPIVTNLIQSLLKLIVL